MEGGDTVGVGPVRFHRRSSEGEEAPDHLDVVGLRCEVQGSAKLDGAAGGVDESCCFLLGFGRED